MSHAVPNKAVLEAEEGEVSGTKQARMLVDQPDARAVLQKIVARVSRDSALHEDLLQEGMIHLWKIELERPGHSRSWYLQNCRYHLQHLLQSGRSIDALKRRRSHCVVSLHDPEYSELVQDLEAAPRGTGESAMREIITLLSRHLRKREQAILSGIAEGLKTREIASRLSISYPTAIKCRRRIATLLIRWGIAQARNDNGATRTVPAASRRTRAKRTSG